MSIEDHLRRMHAMSQFSAQMADTLGPMYQAMYSRMIQTPMPPEQAADLTKHSIGIVVSMWQARKEDE